MQTSSQPVQRVALSLQVLKLGGSLLALPDWPRRVEAWLARKPQAPALLIVGGGTLVDALREEDARAVYPAELMHRAAITCMDVHGRLAATRLGNCQLYERWGDYCAARQAVQTFTPDALEPPLALANVTAWLAELEPLAQARRMPILPASWSVTSDSISAWLAGYCAAEELTLFKSCLPGGAIKSSQPRADKAQSTETKQLSEWADSGYVDGEFPRWARKLRQVRTVNLADKSFPERLWINPAFASARS
jgi:dihydroneopterin aldolase